MPQNPATAPDKTKKEETKSAPDKTPSGTRKDLNNLRDVLSGKKKVSELIRDLLNDYKNLPPEERKKRIISILGMATLTYLFGNGKTEEKESGRKAKNKELEKTDKKKSNKDEAEEDNEDETEEDPPEEDPHKEVYQVACNERRLTLINVDPAGSRAPGFLKARPTYLLEYGLPAKYENFEKGRFNRNSS